MTLTPIFPGGNRDSNHIVYAGHAFRAQGYDVVAFIARGCGGLPLTTPESFTAARTSDLQAALLHLRSLYPETNFFAVGYSLGAGILLKYLGQAAKTSQLSAAVAVSPSWNFLISTPVFEFWSRYRLVGKCSLSLSFSSISLLSLLLTIVSGLLVEGLREYLLDHLSFLRSHPLNNIKIDQTLTAVNVREFDQYAVVPAQGYRDVDHYYFDASAINHSKGITTPTLALSSDDDPVCSVEGCPWDDKTQFGPGLVVARTRVGGHVGFSTYELLLGKSTSWMDLVAVDWFEAFQMQKRKNPQSDERLPSPFPSTPSSSS
jgi:abhydrolase domain-containing protein 1/3